MMIKNFIAVVCCLMFFAGAAAAKTVRLDYIGENPLVKGKPSKDTLPAINATEKFEWDVVAVNSKGATLLRLTTKKPDTVKFAEPATVNLSTTFIVNPRLLNQIYALHFHELSGSISVLLNGELLAATGMFAKDGNSKLSSLNADDYTYFVFKDTVEKMEVTYITHPNMNFVKLTLNIEDKKQVDENKKEEMKSLTGNSALGFYYLAFAIIFIVIFFFLKEKTENLYFSLFCLCASLSLLWDSFNFDLLDGGGAFLFVLALEFLSIFFSKILRNKEKSKVPLIVILGVTAISFSPLVSYNYSILFGEPVPLIKICIISAMSFYAVVSSIYFLAQGVGQKRWEARAVMVIVASAGLLFFIIPAIAILIVANRYPTMLEQVGTVSHYAHQVGLCIYPLSAAIVLARRNGMNQKQLVNQVKSIQKLSHENLEREKERQLLLENQNTELERKVKERTVEVERQKELIEIKNKAITDNLTYAQRIQSAILPDIKLIYKALAQSFILYLPKDIVSGDFYAFAERNGRVLIIAGDCTGHGVSGAFMSMIGGSLLNQIINERGIEEPALILNQLNASVIEALNQSENDSAAADGMDVSVCSFDLNSNELQYAGANRPLWLIRNNNIETFAPDKFPIGGLQMARDRVFTNYTVRLQKNDTIYIFTDGYADQFGGGLGKKMMTAKFKEMLLSIQGMDMREQEKHLKDHFEEWKGHNEQVDDVLVIGVRV